MTGWNIAYGWGFIRTSWGVSAARGALDWGALAQGGGRDEAGAMVRRLVFSGQGGRGGGPALRKCRMPAAVGRSLPGAGMSGELNRLIWEWCPGAGVLSTCSDLRSALNRIEWEYPAQGQVDGGVGAW